MKFPLTLHDLRSHVVSGYRPKFLFFWSHERGSGRSGDDVRQECLSQWYPSPFVVDNVHYLTAEHFMMAAKARLFDDREAEAAILRSPHPAAAKKHGRVVRGFDEARWEQARADLVVQGNVAKFGQHRHLRAYLVGTNDRILVEASPTDTIWGIGLAADHPDAAAPALWRGLNLLGFALMKVREHVR